MSLRAKNTILFIVAIFISYHASAQETPYDYDYRAYKFYKEDAYEPLWLIDDDMLSSNSAVVGFEYAIPTYLSTRVSTRARGMGYEEQRYFAGGLEIDYATARLLSSMRYDRVEGMGLSGVESGGALVASTTYRLTEPRRYSSRHTIRGDVSGRNYVGSMSYATQFKASPTGVGLKSDPMVSIMARGHGGRDIYVDGVYRDGMEIGAGVVCNPGVGVLDVTAMLSWSKRGLRQATTEEAFSLLGDVLYNPSWGMQGTAVRNARTVRELSPELLASWRVRVGAFTELQLTTDVRYDTEKFTSLTWFNASSPLPDYYRYMPSFFSDSVEGLEVERAWRQNDMRYTQIYWDNLYHINLISPGGEAVYAVEGRHNRRLRSGLTALFCGTYKSVTIDYGLTLDYVGERMFKSVDDLLGAQYFIDYDYFNVGDGMMRESLQNNLRTPDRKVREGDKFGYDYRLTRYRASIFAEAEWGVGDNRFSLGVSLASESVRRRGYYEKELFKGALSYGASRRVSFTPYAVQAAWLRSFGAHVFSVRMVLRGESPERDELFLQPQYNNRIIDNPRLVTTLALQGTYRYYAPKVEFVAQPYFIVSGGESDVVRYYDGLAYVYCDAVVSGIGRVSYGVDATANVTYLRRLSSQFAVRLGDYRYSKDANVVIYTDRSNSIVASTTANMRGCHEITPKISLYANLRYRSLNGWSATLAAQYHALRYVAPSYMQRTERVVSFVASPEEQSCLMSQQRLADALCFDVDVSKSFKFANAGSLRLQLTVRNILGCKMVYSGYEQDRVRVTRNGGRMVAKPLENKLLYAYPRTYQIVATYYF